MTQTDMPGETDMPGADAPAQPVYRTTQQQIYGCIDPVRGLWHGLSLTDADIDRFWSKVTVVDPVDCWLWEGSRQKATGYGQFWLSSVGRCVGAHRVACQLSHGCGGPLALHSCDTPECISPVHLRWGTPKQNIGDAVRRGRMAHGERQHLAKLDEERVVEIRRARANGTTLKVLANRFGVHIATIHAVTTFKTWRHVA